VPNESGISESRVCGPDPAPETKVETEDCGMSEMPLLRMSVEDPTPYASSVLKVIRSVDNLAASRSLKSNRVSDPPLARITRPMSRIKTSVAWSGLVLIIKVTKNFSRFYLKNALISIKENVDKPVPVILWAMAPISVSAETAVEKSVFVTPRVFNGMLKVPKMLEAPVGSLTILIS
jgi:hypothetical protein